MTMKSNKPIRCVTVPQDASIVNPDRRVFCLTCLRACPYGAKRVKRLRSMLTKAGVDGERVKIGHLTEFEFGRFLQFVKE